jgi:hypothetical protein
MTREQYLEVHKLISEELRHTSTVIWQFSIAIITLQGGAVGLSVQNAFEGILGTYVLIVAFFLSFPLLQRTAASAGIRKKRLQRSHSRD